MFLYHCSESTIKRNRSAIGERTAWEVWTQEKDNLMKAIRLLGCMPEEKIDEISIEVFCKRYLQRTTIF